MQPIEQSETESKNGSGEHELWCVELVHKKKEMTDRDLAKVTWLAKGVPSDPDEALLWAAMILGGVADDRGPDFARVRQRLVVLRIGKTPSPWPERKKTNSGPLACARCGSCEPARACRV